MSSIHALAAQIRNSRGLHHKADIAGVMRHLAINSRAAIPVGDDTAIIPDGDSHLLFAIEGFVEDFVKADPWFAGYCGVMVNVSDILAMGGRPIAVVDALWSRDEDHAVPLLAGMREAAQRYQVPIVGGHSNLRAASGQLAVAILGRAQRPVTSFGAAPGDSVLVATDLAGRFRAPFPWWDASTMTSDTHLRGLMAIMPDLAEAGLLSAAKDISMGGPIGTAIMLAEASRVGLAIDLDLLPMPPGISLESWLDAFPSFGFVMTAPAAHASAIIARFADEGVHCAAVGHATADPAVSIAHQGHAAVVWSGHEPLIGCHAHQNVAEEFDHA